MGQNAARRRGTQHAAPYSWGGEPQARGREQSRYAGSMYEISLRTWHRASENSNCSGISRCSHVICEVNILSTMGRKSGYDVEPPKNWPTGNPRGQRGYLPWGALVKSQRCGTRLSRPSSPGGALRRDPVCAHDAGKCLLTQMDHHWTGTSRGLSRLDTATPRMNFDGSIGLC